MDSYAEALAYLNRRVDYEKVRPVKFDPRNLNLARIEDLLARLGNPHTQYPVIHVAGTNGKGSVCALLDSMARAAGVRTGLYTSPHFHTLRERIRLNGAMITRHDFVTRLNTLIPHIEEDSELTWFEIVTALGLLHFAQEKVQLAVIEVGAGGRVDATNVVTPWVSVITTLSMDHMAWFGNSLDQIAAEKAGIIKPNVPVVSAPQKTEALTVLETIAHERHAPLTVISRDVPYQKISSTLNGQEFQIAPEAPTPYALPLLGEHQIINAATAITALRVAQQRGLPINDAAIRAGLLNVQWPGRLEILAREPLLVIDGAHNSHSAQRLAAALREVFQHDRWTLVIGISADKDAAAILDALLPIAARVIVTRARNIRAAEVDTLSQRVADRGVEPTPANDVAAALDIALTDRFPIIITGSLYTVADARIAWFKRSGAELPETDDQ